MRTFFLQPPIVALTAVCIAVPAVAPGADAVAAKADPHAALTTSASPALASYTSSIGSNLKLVLAEVGTAPELGAAVGKAFGPKF